MDGDQSTSASWVSLWSRDHSTAWLGEVVSIIVTIRKRVNVLVMRVTLRSISGLDLSIDIEKRGVRVFELC